MVDLLVRIAIALAFAAVGALLYLVSADAGEVGLAAGALVGMAVGVLVYAPLLMAKRNGQTLGHSAASIRVVYQDGARITGGQAFVREVLVKALLIEAVGAFLFYVPTLLNYLWPLWDDRSQALHDKLCSTVVVRA